MADTMKTFVIGDIHGGYRALLQVFDRAQFDYDHDTLIALGDLVDGWPQSKEVMNELLKIKRLILLLGNHDEWFLTWVDRGCRQDWDMDEAWLNHGRLATLQSYAYGNGFPPAHRELFRSARLVYRDAANRVFVHAGLDPTVTLDKQPRNTCLWDRELLQQAYKAHQHDPAARLTPYQEIYVGHTTTQNYHSEVPVQFCEVWAMDTGAGWEGRLSMLDVETKELFQSDEVVTLYPDTEHVRVRSRVFKIIGEKPWRR